MTISKAEMARILDRGLDRVRSCGMREVPQFPIRSPSRLDLEKESPIESRQGSLLHAL